MQLKPQLQLDQLVKLDHVTPIIRTTKEIKKEGESVNAMATASKDKTSIPNWMMGFIIIAFFSLLGFVYNTIDRQITRLENDLSTQKLLMQNTREKLIEHGWTVDKDGSINPPPTATKLILK